MSKREKSEFEPDVLLTLFSAADADAQDFTHVVHHDLHAPLRAILHYAQRLGEEHAVRLDDSARQLVEEIARQARLAQAKLDALQELGEQPLLGDGPESLDLAELIAGVVADLRSETIMADVEIELADRWPRVRADRQAVQILYRELIRNAVIYNDSEPPRVRLDWDRARLPWFFVDDNGIGIPPGARDRAMQAFTRLHPPGERGEGLGVGLNRVRRAVFAHGGQIELRDSPLGGTRVAFTLAPG